MTHKHVVLDTNIFMNHSGELQQFEKIFINATIIEEIDNLKNSESYERAFKARRASRAIEQSNNIEFINQTVLPKVSAELDMSKNDNAIICFTKSLMQDYEDITLITEDLNVFFKSRSVNVPVKKWESNIRPYNGIREVWISENEYIQLLERSKDNIYNLHPNEYLIVNNTTRDEQYLLMWNSSYYDDVKIKNIENKYEKIKPKDIYQKAFIHMLQNVRVRIKVTDSGLGCGKSYLMIHWALQMIEKEKYNKMIFIKSDSPPQGRREFPAIPGGIADKCEPLLGVLCDTTSENSVTDILLRNSKLEILPIQFVRGRSIKNSVVLINEAQNFTPGEMMLILSRLDEGSVALLDGSTQQIDNRRCLYRNGLTVASENFKDSDIAAQVNLKNDYRSSVSRLVASLDWTD